MSDRIKSPETAQKKRRFAPAQGGFPGRGPRPGPAAMGKPKPKLKNARSTITRLFKYLMGVKWELTFALIALLASTATTLITPTISGNIIDILKQGFNTNPGQTLAATFGIGLASSAMLDRARGYKLKGRLLNIVTQSGIFSIMSAIVLSVIGPDSAEATTEIEQLSYTQQLGVQLFYLGGLYLVSSLCSLAQQLLLVRVSQHTVRTIRTDLFGKLQGLSLKYFDSAPHGELMSRLIR